MSIESSLTKTETFHIADLLSATNCTFADYKYLKCGHNLLYLSSYGNSLSKEEKVHDFLYRN